MIEMTIGRWVSWVGPVGTGVVDGTPVLSRRSLVRPPPSHPHTARCCNTRVYVVLCQGTLPTYTIMRERGAVMFTSPNGTPV